MSVFLHVFTGLFLVVGLGLVGYGGSLVLKANRAASWPTTEGTLIEHRLTQRHDGDGSSYQVKATYAYTVDGTRYESDRIAFGYGASNGRATHESLDQKLGSGSTVVVRYDPERPQEAVLSCGVNNGIRFLLVFGCTWTLFTIGLYVLVRPFLSADTTLLDNLIVR